ncbi:MAG: efflux RND transporter permease subunit, partial [Lentisphaeria bacterium]
EFENIIVKTTNEGGQTKLKDVANVELGAKNYGQLARLNGRPSAAVAIFQRPGANALKVSEAVIAKMNELKSSFPSDLKYSVPLDTTKFVTDSIKEVGVTLVVAIILVVITIFAFLQDWRATVIPTITIPVSLIGTFAVMYVIGFSINLLTLFGLILAIGIVVDDAIVVVESTAHHIEKNKLKPYDAAVRAMNEVSGAVVATTLVLLAVFVPSALMGGITGQMFRQFAVTISVATVFSSVNALTLTPALASLLLREPSGKKKFIFFRMFEWCFDRSITGYRKIVRGLIRFSSIALIIFGVIIAGIVLGMRQLPTGFLPTEDMGYAMGMVQLPDAASFERSDKMAEEVYQKISAIEGIEYVVTVPGYSIIDGAVASNCVTFWLVFTDINERVKKDLTLEKLMVQINGAFFSIKEGVGFAFTPPSINGLGNAGGFEVKIEDRGNLGTAALEQALQDVASAASGQSVIKSARSTFSAGVPQYTIKLNRDKVKQYDMKVSDVYSTLQTYLGGSYINDFNEFGRTYQVKLQAKGDSRAKLEDIRKLQVRNIDGKMVPVGNIVDIIPAFGPQLLNRYNMYPSASITGDAAEGYSSGEALAMIEKTCKEVLPAGIGYEWTGMSYQEKIASGGAIVVFILSALFGYLFLCAQYESWSLSFCVVMSVPLALLGTVIGVMVRGMDVNIYTQIGIVLLIGLAAKTAILIVEFARDLRKSGQSIVEAAENAATQRFRAVLMTAISFVFGTYPLLVAVGSGAASRQALGTAVFWGMVSGTIFTIFLVPAFYKAIQAFSEKLSELRNKK